MSAIGTKLAVRTVSEKSEGVQELPPAGKPGPREPYTKDKQVGKKGRGKSAPKAKAATKPSVFKERTHSAAGQKRAAAKPAAKTNGNGNGGTAHVRHAKDGKWVLVKDLTKFGPDNRVVQNRFASEQSALDYAKEHGIKVIGNGK